MVTIKNRVLFNSIYSYLWLPKKVMFYLYSHPSESFLYSSIPSSFFFLFLIFTIFISSFSYITLFTSSFFISQLQVYNNCLNPSAISISFVIPSDHISLVGIHRYDLTSPSINRSFIFWTVLLKLFLSICSEIVLYFFWLICTPKDLLGKECYAAYIQ